MLRFVFVLLTLSHASSLVFNCKFYFLTLGDDKLYLCKARNLNLTPKDFVVSKVSQKHLQGYSDKNVVGIEVINQNCPIIPPGLAKFYPSVEALNITRSNLERINSKDLKPFKMLYALTLNYNKLKILDKNLFEFSPRIDFVDFTGNQIKTIGENLLKPLKRLRAVYFRGNECVDLDCDVAGGEVLAILNHILTTNCSVDTIQNLIDSKV